MKKFNFNLTKFVTSIADCRNLPPDTTKEIAFAGRSNSGKSSAINSITNISKLAKTSKSPGRTTLINFFLLDENKYLVDLPGYGYAKVSKQTKRQWDRLITTYLTKRQSLIGVFLLMDIRHPLKEFDWHMLELASYQDLPVHILLNKSDKLKRNAQKNTLMKVQQELDKYEIEFSIQLFSSLAKTGIEEAQDKLTEWLSD